MSACPRCGQAGMRDATHVCPPPGAAAVSLDAVSLDVHHWLYKAGYDDGYQAALRERDLSPMGRSPSGKERGG